MKKAILTFLGCLLVLATYAQRDRGWLLGFEISPGYYSILNEMDKNARPEIIAFDNPEIFSAPRNWAVGGKAIYMFTQNIGLQTGVRYYWGRQDYTFGYGVLQNTSQEGNITTELNFIQVPLMLHWQTENKSGMRFYATAGVAPAWLFHYYENTTLIWDANFSSHSTIVNTETQHKYNSIIVQDNGEVEVRQSQISYQNRNNDEHRLYKTFNLFLSAEIGFLVPLSEGWHFNVGFNYYQSLVNPDNIQGSRWELDKYTRNEIPPSSSVVEEPTKYDRPKSTILSLGLTLGLVYEFEW